ncbi:MAG: family 78 glycoside hydrolase catalytic domain [Bacteroidales bacterium]|nr:family 78 glycoside hydrolase catalytic domain [Bacteroidales bacterium]
MKTRFFLICIFCISSRMFGQILPELNYPQPRYEVEKWKAAWITCPDVAEADYSVTMYRRSFFLAEQPERFIVHVSADNRYKLYINGTLASIGPQGSDWRHWRYETIDIAPYLKSGNNTLAAEVVNWGPDRYFGIMSIRTAFMLQGETEAEAVVNTTSTGEWKAKENISYAPLAPNWIYGIDIIGGFYATNPGDSVNVATYPQDWTLQAFDDSDWKPAKWIWNISNTNDGGFFWLMRPRTTPQVTQEQQRFRKVARAEGINVSSDFVKGKRPVTVPAYAKVSLLLDNETEVLGFPELIVSGGKGSKISLRYAENLFNDDFSKGDRNDIKGKHIRGLRDVLMLDGREQFRFSPTWYRAFRFVQIDVETADEPVVLQDYYNMATASPMKRRSVFECSNPDYKKIDDICWRTVSICTQDNLMSDAYYEQMMYVGDSRVHGLVNLYMSGDDIWLRNAIEQFDYSRMPDGNITSCYPLKSTFIHPTFSLVWVDMLHDFMMHCNDKEFLRQYAQSVRSTLNWFDNNLQENGLVGKPVGSYFVDWYNDEPFAGAGVYPGSENGNSAVVTLHYAATLLRAADLFDYLDMPSEAMTFRIKAEKVKEDVIAACWDESRGLFAENPDKEFYDERANIMAITAKIFDEKRQKELFNRCLDDKDISKSVYYFRNNHFNEMRRLGEGDKISKVLDIWEDLLPLNMTTTPERIARQRSEAHPWSTAPAMAFVKVIAGIAPAEPGYKSVSIEPALGELDFVTVSYPHYLGDIKVDLKKKGKNGLEGSVELPDGLTGTFKYNGMIIALKGGLQKISL